MTTFSASKTLPALFLFLGATCFAFAEPEQSTSTTVQSSESSIQKSATPTRVGQKHEPPTLAWGTLEAQLKVETDKGFEGVVLVAREGKIVFHKAYGLANRTKQIPMRPDSILAIGSTPIDFTKASILLLVEAGKLRLHDPISRYLSPVPSDKTAITIQHLMTGRSGLPDFHDIPSDRDPDHSWISRDEAVRRILSQKLLFPPGQKREHSHSAFGLLAAIIEIVSGQSYADFTRERLYRPAGMLDTTFFGERYAEERMAIGYGPRKDGQINAPPYWGKTSWLVMGSGGQVSTALDMWRWIQAVKGGKILSPESLKHFTSPTESMMVGGDMYGFEIMYAGNERNFMIVMSNTGSPQQMPQLRALGRALSALVLDRKPAKFSLGIEFTVEDDGRVTIANVLRGSAAERAGLHIGDSLLTAAGKPLGGNPMTMLSPLLQTGETIPFEIERKGQRKTITVQPTPR